MISCWFFTKNQQLIAVFEDVEKLVDNGVRLFVAARRVEPLDAIDAVIAQPAVALGVQPGVMERSIDFEHAPFPLMADNEIEFAALAFTLAAAEAHARGRDEENSAMVERFGDADFRLGAENHAFPLDGAVGIWFFAALWLRAT